MARAVHGGIGLQPSLLRQGAASLWAASAGNNSLTLRGITGRVGPPFGIVRRTLAVEGKTGEMEPLAVWVTNNTGDGPTWSVSTWCRARRGR